MSATTPLRVGLIGAGLSATTFHSPLLRASNAFEISGVLRNRPDPVSGLEEVPVHTELQEFLAQDPQLVVITTPTHTHFSLAKACLQAGRNVVLEKPMTATYAEAAELCELAREKDRLLAVYQNRRWDGDFLTACDLIKCGVLGRLVEFESHFDRYRPALKSSWKEDAELPGAGVIYDLGSHLVDQALSLFGPPTSVTGLVLNQRHLPVCAIHDAFTITLHYERPEGPLTVLLRSSSLCKTPGARFSLHGTQGSWVKHGMDVQEEQLRAGMSPVEPGFGADKPENYGVLHSQALEMDPALSHTTAPAGPFEVLSEVPEGGVAAPAPAAAAATIPTSPAAAAASVAAAARDDALEAATAAALAGRRMGRGPTTAQPEDSKEGAAAVTVSSIATAVLAKIDAGASITGGGNSRQGACVKLVTQPGCWHTFYEEVGRLLLAGVGGGGGGRGINDQLSVAPEAAAQVIRVIELAVQSSKEGRTVAF